MPRAPHRRPEMADRAQREHQRDAGFGVRPGGALATLAGATVGVVVTSRGSRGAFSRPERGGAVPLLERARSHAMAPMAEERVRPATRGDASARAHSRRFDVGQDTVAMAFPTRSRRPPRWSRGDRVAPTSRIPPRDSRRARYAVHVSRGPVSSPEPATTRGALKTESSAPSIAHLAYPRSQDAAPKPARTREALQNQLYLKPKPPGAAARGPTALGKTARTSLKVRARPPPARAPFVIFFPNESILFGATPIARPDPIRLPIPRPGLPGQARPTPRPQTHARRRRLGDPSHVRDGRVGARAGSARGGISPADARPPDGVVVLRLVPRAPRASLDPR